MVAVSPALSCGAETSSSAPSLFFVAIVDSRGGLDEYNAQLVAHPFATNIATAAFLAFLGDAIAQRSTGPTYDRVRAVSFVLFDAFYRGGFQTVAFPAIIEGCRGDVLQAVADGLSISTDPAILAAIERTAFNQFIVVRLRPFISQKIHHDVNDFMAVFLDVPLKSSLDVSRLIFLSVKFGF